MRSPPRPSGTLSPQFAVLLVMNAPISVLWKMKIEGHIPTDSGKNVPCGCAKNRRPKHVLEPRIGNTGHQFAKARHKIWVHSNFISIYDVTAGCVLQRRSTLQRINDLWSPLRANRHNDSISPFARPELCSAGRTDTSAPTRAY